CISTPAPEPLSTGFAHQREKGLRETMSLQLRTSEWIAAGFFLYLWATALLTRAPSVGRRGVSRRAMLMAAFIGAAAIPTGSAAAAARDWLPLVYLPVGYWLPAHLVSSPNPRFENALLAFDRRLFG